VPVVALGAVAFALPGSAAPAAPPTRGPGAILYSAGGGEQDPCGQIGSIEPSGGEPRPLDVAPGENCEPDWSPDATQIVFVSNRDDRFRLYIADADGSQPTALTSPPPVPTISSVVPGLETATTST